jgi:DNA polymerase-3 subunit epsilon
MLILGIDLEGINEALTFKGVNTKVDRVTEIGAVLWDTRINLPVKIYSELIKEKDMLPLTEEVIDLTGIDHQLLDEWGLEGEQIKMALERLALIMKKADYFMAHNGANYDRPMLTAMFERYGLTIPEKVWIDTQNDIEYPKRQTHKSMAALEHSHGFINPFPHRAVTDVLSMLKIASHYDYNRMAKIASAPKIKIVASLRAPNWKDAVQVEKFNLIKNKVARSGFKWDGNAKEWFKIVSKVHIDEGSLNYDFDWQLS